MPLYFLTVVLVFWVPGLALVPVYWGRLGEGGRKALLVVVAIMAVVSFGMEYVYLWADIWSFSEAHDPLLGIGLWGAPIEEFTYWFGATPFCLGLYFTFQRFRGRGPFATAVKPPRAALRRKGRRRRTR